MFESILERVREGMTTERDAVFLAQVLDPAAAMAGAEWSDGDAWRCLARLRAAISLFNDQYQNGIDNGD